MQNVINTTHQTYSSYYNQRQGETGNLWQGRYFSCPLDDEHLWAAVRYVEMNHVRAGLVDTAESYRWSSAAVHCNARADALLAPTFPPGGVVEDWSQWLAFDSRDQEERLRHCTQAGLVCGSDSFVKKMERRLKRCVVPGKRGRPGQTDA